MTCLLFPSAPLLIQSTEATTKQDFDFIENSNKFKINTHKTKKNEEIVDKQDHASNQMVKYDENKSNLRGNMFSQRTTLD